MRRGHGRYDALAGAVVLGEASAEERSRLTRHAVECAECAAVLDAEFATPFAELARARDLESWRPSVLSPVRRRIAEAGERRWRLTFATLSYVVGLSVVTNLAVATGFVGRLSNLLAPGAAVPAVTRSVASLPSRAEAAASDARGVLFGDARKAAPKSPPPRRTKRRRAPSLE